MQCKKTFPGQIECGHIRQCWNNAAEGKDFCWQHNLDYKSPLEKCKAESARLTEELEQAHNHAESLSADIERMQCLSDVKLEAENIKLKALLEAERWIPVEERLPEEEKEYSVLVDMRMKTFFWYGKEDQWCGPYVVTHWKPINLPKK